MTGCGSCGSGGFGRVRLQGINLFCGLSVVCLLLRCTSKCMVGITAVSACIGPPPLQVYSFLGLDEPTSPEVLNKVSACTRW